MNRLNITYFFRVFFELNFVAKCKKDATKIKFPNKFIQRIFSSKKINLKILK